VTLIVPFISEDFVALSSDRRITWQIGGASTNWEDTENKAIVLAGHFLMGYTGFARLAGRRTEQWVVDTLRQVDDPTLYFNVLAREGERAVKSLGQPVGRSGHAFVAVGYGRFRRDPGALHAFLVTISNALGDGTYGTWRPEPTFSVERSPTLSGSDDFRVSAFGISPPRAEIDLMVDHIQEYRTESPGGIVGVLELMVNLIRSVAARDDRVSSHVSLSVLPRAGVPASGIQAPASSGLIRDPIEQLTCMFVPDGRRPDQADIYVPGSIGPGSISMFDGELWVNRKPPWWRDSP
jgi:hypothetical protein